MRLVRATINDCEKIHNMQKLAFADLLKKYKDYDTSPATESLERIKTKITDVGSFFYFIIFEEKIAGAVRVVDNGDESKKRVSPIFIMKEFRNKGLAQKTFEEIERIHGKENWTLTTILQEKGNCYLYEKLGYKRTGEIININKKMDIIIYEKN